MRSLALPCLTVQDGDYKMQGIARHKHFSECGVFFVALRIFSMLVFNIETGAAVENPPDMAQVQSWLRLPLFPLVQDMNAGRRATRRQDKDTFGSAVKTSLKEGSGMSRVRLHGLNVPSEVRSAATQHMFAAELALEEVVPLPLALPPVPDLKCMRSV